uniref:Flavin reductase like domain-containing protein n=1 Tax=Melanopsichium pennsylvanicum 4 TaxID=1398559 RepID=A0A077RAV4_9BASI|nr:uncharacterized protein BN887_06256 [Melanopsichium pennsylvanicum 4]
MKSSQLAEVGGKDKVEMKGDTSSSSVSTSLPSNLDDGGRGVADQIRALMRESAQPVVLITTFLPTSSDTTNSNNKLSTTMDQTRLIHGATLSSFSSISLDPNLVCFSMKTPSRLADALSHHFTYRRSNVDKQEQNEIEEVDFVVNILSCTQSNLAEAYATPGTPPLPHPPQPNSTPFEKAGNGNKNTTDELQVETHPLNQVGLIYTKQQQQGRGASDMPLVKDSLGSFGCQVIDILDLSKYDQLDDCMAKKPIKTSSSSSVLYVAKVIHVYHPNQNQSHQRQDKKKNNNNNKPLIYHQKKFVSTSDESPA